MANWRCNQEVDSFTFQMTTFSVPIPSPIQRSIFDRPIKPPFTITVNPTYDPVQTVADSYKAIPAERLDIPAIVGVLANDVNIDEATLTAVLDQDVADGSLTLNGDGSFTYDPQGFSGTTSFRYKVDDGDAAIDSPKRLS